MVVTVEPEDTDDFQEHGELAGIAYQHRLERSPSAQGGGQVAPGQRLTDFLAAGIQMIYQKRLPPDCVHLDWMHCCRLASHKDCAGDYRFSANRYKVI